MVEKEQTAAHMTVPQQMYDSRPAGKTDGIDARVLLLLGAVAGGDLLLLAAGLLFEINAWLLLPAHLALVANAGWQLLSREMPDYTLSAIGLLLVLVGGPLGGLGLLVITATERRGRLAEDVLNEWYAWLSGVQRPDSTLLLHDAIQAGREFKPVLGGGRRFADIMRDGTLAEKQTLLGHIGLKFHRDYLPLLEMALRSPQAAVRAQAAAVFVKLKEQFRRRLHDALARANRLRPGDDVVGMLTCAAALLECAASGFLEQGDAQEALGKATTLCKFAEAGGALAGETEALSCRIVAAGGSDDALLDHLMARLHELPAGVAAELARSLVATGRHVDLHKLLATFRLRADPSPSARLQGIAAVIPSAGGVQ